MHLEVAMRIRSLKLIGIPVVLAFLALPLSIQAAQFDPGVDQATTPLIEGKQGSGEVSFDPATVVERIVGGQSSIILSVPIFIENLSRKDLLMQTLDLWVVVADGTVLSQPELSQDGVSANASMGFYVAIMKSKNGISGAQREMLATVVSNANDCFY